MIEALVFAVIILSFIGVERQLKEIKDTLADIQSKLKEKK
jgi:hypothetical protein